MRRIFRNAAVLALMVAALLATSSVAGAASTGKPTPVQQQQLCIAKKSIELLKAIDRKTWKDRKAREAAIRAIPGQAKAACPLGGTPPTPPGPATPTQAELNAAAAAFSPPADRVTSQVRNGATEYVFHWDGREIPANATRGTPVFSVDSNCPAGFRGPGGYTGGYLAENPTNQGSLYITQSGGRDTFVYGATTPPATPTGLSFDRGCTRDATVLPADPS